MLTSTREWVANITALTTIDPQLADRIMSASIGAHIKIQDNHIFVLNGKKWHNLFLEKEFRTTTIQIGIFGLGSPSFIDQAIQSPAVRIILWDRDPSLLRLLLASRDFSTDILTGRVKLALGADLLLHMEDTEWHFHPVLSRLYRWEVTLLRNRSKAKWVLLATGGLFVDDLWEALTKEGYNVFPFAIDIHSLSELKHTALKVGPEFAFMINYVHGTAAFFAELEIPLRCWEIDPATDYIRSSDSAGDTIIFSYRKKNISTWQEKGYQAEYLPLGSNSSRRKPHHKKQSGISFVGASMMSTSEKYREHLYRVAAELSGDRDHSQHQIESLIAEQLTADVYRADQKFRELFPHWPAGVEDPTMLLGEIIASSYRFHVIERLAKFDIELWGDRGWNRLQKSGINYRGPAGHFKELNEIYQTSLINIDIGRRYQSDIVTMRVFDILACKGFVLAAHSDALGELFAIGTEIESWRTIDELEEKVSWYLKNPARAAAIAEQGYRRVIKDHTIRNRLRKILSHK